MSLVQIPGTTLVRDTNSMGLINRDRNGLEDYNAKRKILEQMPVVSAQCDVCRDDLLFELEAEAERTF